MLPVFSFVLQYLLLHSGAAVPATAQQCRCSYRGQQRPVITLFLINKRLRQNETITPSSERQLMR